MVTTVNTTPAKHHRGCGYVIMLAFSSKHCCATNTAVDISSPRIFAKSYRMFPISWLLHCLSTECPTQFWGPDCKGKCNCYPNGQCDDLTGECTCNHNRWGPNCENACLCQKGKCDQETGKCTCHPGVWGPQCNNNCYCSINSVCDAMTGRCLCNPGWTGRNCAIQCNCNNSPCDQFTGRCQCRERLWGPRCERYCQCVHGKCNQADGSCTCTPGYRGKFCREPCPAGFYGQNCRNRWGKWHCRAQMQHFKNTASMQPCIYLMFSSLVWYISWCSCCGFDRK